MSETPAGEHGVEKGLPLAVVTRPNGKVYRARKPAVCVGFSDYDDEYAFVAAMRTHDLELAASFARPYRGDHLHFRRLTWIRETIRDGEPYFEEDATQGVPAVVFIECYEGSCEAADTHGHSVH